MPGASASGSPPAFVLGLDVAGLAVVRALGREGIPVVGFDARGVSALMRGPAFASRYCRSRFVPDVHRDPEGVQRAIESEAGRYAEKPVLFWTSDPYIELVVARRDALARTFRFALPPPEVAEGLLDKRRQLALADRAGLLHPPTYHPETRDDVLALRDAIEYPAFIKPCVGHRFRRDFGRTTKGFEVRTPAELVRRFDEVLASGHPAMIQTVVLGPASNHLKYCAYVGRSGEILASFTGRKLRQYPPRFGVGTLCESVDLPEVAAIGRSFLEKIGYRGFASIELKRDERDGRIKLIELNGRPIFHGALMLDAGLNFPLVEYLDLTDRPPRRAAPQRSGVKWWSAVDAKTFLALHRSGEMSAIAWARTWIDARSFAVFAWDDPIPFARCYGGRAAWVLANEARRRLRGA